ncbi:mandelate racemase/muconate lactonizing enzyme family protein [Jeotgalibacillus marinus]|uniref:Dipeptide epimerase n=1 Tax=Jeotgalibacillus marinus TaxID=86667 RepID=A0ABV3Q0C1_9BACL
MNIVEARLWGIHLPLKEPFVISYATFHHMPSIIVQLKTDDGLVGYGEAVPDEHVTGESFLASYELLKHQLLPAIMNQSPFNIEAIHARLDDSIRQNPSIKAAIDIACYDLMGKAIGQPIYNLIGGKAHDRQTYPKVISIGTPDEMVDACKKALHAGYEELKIKVSGDVKVDIIRLQAIREAVTSNVPIRIDVNQGWRTYDQAKRALAKLEQLELDWVEQPLDPSYFNEMSELRKQTSTPLMLDESIHNAQDLQRAITTRSADKINIKLMKCGGIYPAIHLAKTAEAAGLTCQIGSMVESSIGSAAGYHVALSKRNITGTELTGPLLFSKDIGDLLYDIPTVSLSGEPGLGITVNHAILEDLSVKQDKVTF